VAGERGLDLADELALDGDDGRYRVVVPSRWEGIPGSTFGGFVAAVALRAVGLVAEIPRPASAACQFLRPTVPEVPVDVTVEVLRRGRRDELLRVVLAQQGSATFEAAVRTADRDEGYEYAPARMPMVDIDPAQLPTLSEVIRAEGGSHGRALETADYRTSWTGEPQRTVDGREAIIGWVRFGEGCCYDDLFLEAARVMMPLDSQVPAILERAGSLSVAKGEPEYFGTSLDMLAQFHRAEPATPWLYYEATSTIAHHGLATGVSEVWTHDGRLFATCLSQVAFLRRPAFGG
jgi:acyl-CoA thioesterase